MFAIPSLCRDRRAPAGGARPALHQHPPAGSLIFVIFYFLLIRPQQKRMKQHQAMIGAVKPRDTAVTNGGLIGKVTKVDENEVELEIAPGRPRPGGQVDAERRPPARRQGGERLRPTC